jgi:hypothetical protein
MSVGKACEDPGAEAGLPEPTFSRAGLAHDHLVRLDDDRPDDAADDAQTRASHHRPRRHPR